MPIGKGKLFLAKTLEIEYKDKFHPNADTYNRRIHINIYVYIYIVSYLLLASSIDII